MSGLGSSLGLAQRKTWLLSHLPLSAQEGVPSVGVLGGKPQVWSVVRGL